MENEQKIDWEKIANEPIAKTEEKKEEEKIEEKDEKELDLEKYKYTVELDIGDKFPCDSFIIKENVVYAKQDNLEIIVLRERIKVIMEKDILYLDSSKFNESEKKDFYEVQQEEKKKIEEGHQLEIDTFVNEERAKGKKYSRWELEGELQERKIKCDHYEKYGIMERINKR